MKFRKYILTKKNYKYVMGILNKKVQNCIYDIFINYSSEDVNKVKMLIGRKIKINFDYINENGIKVYTTNKDIIIKNKDNETLIEMLHTEDSYNIYYIMSPSCLINITIGGDGYLTYDNEFNMEGEDINE